MVIERRKNASGSGLRRAQNLRCDGERKIRRVSRRRLRRRSMAVDQRSSIPHV
ncbi:hypothetical protein N665_0395s0038 [Sinapis alba]|nr:hypothetical protein N665_0395s0038 [Sinapis alba]